MRAPARRYEWQPRRRSGAQGRASWPPLPKPCRNHVSRCRLDSTSPPRAPIFAACSNAASAPMGSSPPASRPVLPSRLAVERATGGVTRPAPLMTNVFTSPGPKRHMVAVLGDVKAMDGSACADAASGNCSSWAGRHVAGERPSYCLLRGTALGHNCHS
jgi:hypothetical protein